MFERHKTGRCHYLSFWQWVINLLKDKLWTNFAALVNMITLSCIIVHVSFIFRSENRRSCNETNLLNYASEVSLNRIGQKEISLVFKNRQGENSFLTYPPAYVECAWEYILFVSKEHTQTKKSPLANLFVWIYVFLFKQ